MYATIYNDISRYSVHMYNERVNNQFFLYFCVFDTFRPSWKFIRLTLQSDQFASRDKFLYLYPALHHEKLREHM